MENKLLILKYIYIQAETLIILDHAYKRKKDCLLFHLDYTKTIRPYISDCLIGTKVNFLMIEQHFLNHQRHTKLDGMPLGYSVQW
jgi:hypothetical protein